MKRRLAPALIATRLLPALAWAALSYPAFRRLTFLDPADPLELARRLVSAAFAALVICFFLMRLPRRGTQAGLIPSATAFAGTTATLLLVGAPVLHEEPALLAAGSGLALAGMIWSFASLVCLGRCFGVRPAARGLVTRGPYRLVRHPLYLGELTMGLGILLPLLSPITLALWFLAAGLQVCRAQNEESTLSAAFPAYENYRARTRFLVPGLW